MTEVKVVDDRPDGQIILNAFGYGGGSFLLQPNPAVDTALQTRLAQSPRASQLEAVRIERIDLVAKIGYGTFNDLSCEITSNAVLGPNGSEVRVRTIARETKDFSSRLTSMAEAILPQCLDAHATDLTTKAASATR